MRRLYLASAAAAALFASTASATVMIEHSLEDMARDADLIVRGRVEDVGVQLVLRNGALEPRTRVRISVSEWIKGSGGPTVVVRELGGEWQGGGMRIDGTPVYHRGEEVVVFLERYSELGGDHLRTYGMVQGRFLVRQGLGGVPTSVERDHRSISFARWANGQMVLTRGNRPPAMELEGFLTYVRGILSAYGGSR